MSYTIREDGKNGTVEIHPDRVVRTIKKLVGKDDTQTIPVKHITSVHHDRKMIGSGSVELTTSGRTYEWKVKNAEKMVAELEAAIYGH